jgi:hypothetical protein
MFFNYLKNQDENKYFWLSPGAGHYVVKTDNFLEEAEESLKVLQNNDKNEIVEKLFNYSSIKIK